MNYIPVVIFFACLGVGAYLTLDEKPNHSRYPSNWKMDAV